MPNTITELVNSLTSEQYLRLIQIAAPLTPEERAEMDEMTDDELLKALQS
jgi:hypothetical protein